MSTSVEINTTVKNGFPVIVTASLCPVERDVGIMTRYLEDIEVLTVKGKPCKWLKLSEADYEDIAQKVWSSLS